MARRGSVTLNVEAGVEYAGRVVTAIGIGPVGRSGESLKESSNRSSLPNGQVNVKRYEESEVDFFSQLHTLLTSDGSNRPIAFHGIDMTGKDIEQQLVTAILNQDLR